MPTATFQSIYSDSHLTPPFFIRCNPFTVPSERIQLRSLLLHDQKPAKRKGEKSDFRPGHNAQSQPRLLLALRRKPRKSAIFPIPTLLAREIVEVSKSRWNNSTKAPQKECMERPVGKMQQNGQNKLHEVACIGEVELFGAQF